MLKTKKSYKEISLLKEGWLPLLNFNAEEGVLAFSKSLFFRVNSTTPTNTRTLELSNQLLILELYEGPTSHIHPGWHCDTHEEEEGRKTKSGN